MRVDDERIGTLDAVPHPPAFGEDHRRAGHRGIDVQPESMLRRRSPQSARIGSSAVEAVVPVVATTAQGFRPAARSAATSVGERIGTHCEGIIIWHDADVLAAEAREQCGLLDRAVALRRRVDRQRFRLAPASRLARARISMPVREHTPARSGCRSMLCPE